MFQVIFILLISPNAEAIEGHKWEKHTALKI